MKKIIIIAIALLVVIISQVVADECLYLAQRKECCKKREWLAGEWQKTELSFSECEELNRMRDGVDNILKEKGDVWWDMKCK